LKHVGFHAKELRTVGYTAKDVQDSYEAEVLSRAGYTKSELKPLGLWIHDGEWQNYNQYWNCCFSLDKRSKFCNPITHNF
jgi:hypothetical protein